MRNGVKHWIDEREQPENFEQDVGFEPFDKAAYDARKVFGFDYLEACRAKKSLHFG